MSKLGAIGHRLYTGEVSYDFIGRRRRWYTISAILIALSLLSLAWRGLDFGIEFKGGADFKLQPRSMPRRSTRCGTRFAIPAFQTSTRRPSTRSATTKCGCKPGRSTRPKKCRRFGPRSPTRWRSTRTRSHTASSGPHGGARSPSVALIALAVFLVLVALVIGIYFRDAKMSAAALIALVHDLILTIGIYALVGFTVTPATLIGVLTILGYSLYDTVVVFDKVREDVRDIRSSTTRTYSRLPTSPSTRCWSVPSTPP